MLNEWSVIKEFLTKHFNMPYYKIKFEKAVPCSKFVNNTLVLNLFRQSCITFVFYKVNIKMFFEVLILFHLQ